MRPRFHIAILLGTMLLLASCGKDYDRFSMNRVDVDTTWRMSSATSQDLQKLFASIAVQPQAIEVTDIASLDTIYFNGPAAIATPERGLQSTGGSVATGKAVVELTLLRTKGEFIRNSKPSCSSRLPVMSKAMANVRISQNGKDLQLKPGATLSITFADAVPDPLIKAFYAEAPAPDKPYSEWVPATDGTYAYNYLRPPNGGILGTVPAGYTVNFAQLRWVNCGSFGDTTAHDHMTVTLPLPFTNGNTAVFVVPRELPTVIQMDAEPRHQYFLTDKVPYGQPVKVVSITYTNGEYYLGFTDARSSDGLNVIVKPQKVTLEGLLTFLNTL